MLHIYTYISYIFPYLIDVSLIYYVNCYNYMKLNDDCIQLSYLTLLKSFKIVENDDNTFDQSM